jgi:ribosomal protein L16/L10AE
MIRQCLPITVIPDCAFKLFDSHTTNYVLIQLMRLENMNLTAKQLEAEMNISWGSIRIHANKLEAANVATVKLRRKRGPVDISINWKDIMETNDYEYQSNEFRLGKLKAKR